MPNVPPTTYLIVEGAGDVAFFEHALRQLKVKGVEVKPTQGTGNLRKVLLAAASAPHVSKFAVIFDADTKHAGYWQTYVAHFAAAGLPTPIRPGEWVSGSKDERAIQAMLYLLPGPGEIGAIETLLLKTLVGSAGYACVDELVKCWTDAGIVVAEAGDKVRMQA